MPLQATSGAASYDAFGGGVAVVPTYIEDVFSTYLYTGNGSTQTITNGIDLSTKGGLVWIKGRIGTGEGHTLFDTARGVNQVMQTQNTDASANFNNSLTAFNTTGFSLGTNRTDPAVNYVSWTFRKQPKFFDIVTYTGTGSTRSVSHNLGCVPGFIIVKNTSNTANWAASLAPDADWNNRKILLLNTTDADGATATYTNGFINTATSTTVSLTQNAGTNVNASGNTYVMYLFAHNAGGFGLTGTDNVISCGSFNYNTDPQTVTIGYEPQWLMVKRYDGVGDWIMFDNMRGFTANAGGGAGKRLLANTSGAETANDGLYYGGATGFNLNLPAYGNYIYIAIRRGPMKVPSTGSSVFAPITSAASTGTTLTTGFPIDFQIEKIRGAVDNNYVVDRLRGVNTTGVTGTGGPFLVTNTTAAEVSNTNLAISNGWDNTSFKMPSGFATLSSVFWSFGRAPSFMDVVCYTGTGVAGRTVTHNLAAVPELMIVKNRVSARNWRVYAAPLGASSSLNLNSDAADGGLGAALWNSTAPTSSVFSLGTDSSVNASADTYVAYLFATCVGVSKVGSYSGNTSNIVTVNCGFTSGARFVLIKRTDSTGDWWTYDSARGISSSNDPYLFLNSTAAEVTSTNYVDTDSTGFKVTAAAPAGLNASGGTYIFLAIA